MGYDSLGQTSSLLLENLLRGERRGEQQIAGLTLTSRLHAEVCFRQYNRRVIVIVLGGNLKGRGQEAPPAAGRMVPEITPPGLERAPPLLHRPDRNGEGGQGREGITRSGAASEEHDVDSVCANPLPDGQSETGPGDHAVREHAARVANRDAALPPPRVDGQDPHRNVS
jgi:hypothetical protein